MPNQPNVPFYEKQVPPRRKSRSFQTYLDELEKKSLYTPEQGSGPGYASPQPTEQQYVPQQPSQPERSLVRPSRFSSEKPLFDNNQGAITDVQLQMGGIFLLSLGLWIFSGRFVFFEAAYFLVLLLSFYKAGEKLVVSGSHSGYSFVLGGLYFIFSLFVFDQLFSPLWLSIEERF